MLVNRQELLAGTIFLLTLGFTWFTVGFLILVCDEDMHVAAGLFSTTYNTEVYK